MGRTVHLNDDIKSILDDKFQTVDGAFELTNLVDVNNDGTVTLRFKTDYKEDVEHVHSRTLVESFITQNSRFRVKENGPSSKFPFVNDEVIVVTQYAVDVTLNPVELELLGTNISAFKQLPCYQPESSIPSSYGTGQISPSDVGYEK